MSCSEFEAYSRLNIDVVGAEGDELVLRDGSRILDLYGGHCVNTLGAGDDLIGRRIAEQWGALSFATNLVNLDVRRSFFAAFGANLPDADAPWRVFLSNSGAEANENALKAALASTSRPAVVCFEGAFHGRTAATSAVSDTRATGFPSTPFEVRRIPFVDRDAALEAIDEDVAVVLLEPIQSMAGVIEASDAYLGFLRSRCTEVGALLAFDEVQTGNGRLGVPWASQECSVVPDLFTTAKGAAGGLPIGITVLSEELAASLPSGLFGSTFGGGPIALAAATVVAEQLAAGPLLENVNVASMAFREACLVGPVRRIRGTGLLLGIEIEEGVSALGVQRALLKAGILIGTTRDAQVLRLTPPLTVAPHRSEFLHNALENISVGAISS